MPAMKSFRSVLGATMGWGVFLSIVVVLLSGCQGAGSGQATDVGAAGAGTTPVPDTPSEGAADAAWSDLLRVGDRITVTFAGIATAPATHQEQITGEGYITPPLLPAPGVKAVGKTTSELQQELHRLYVPNIFKSITITVRNEERYFFVGGEVKDGGMKPHLTEMSLVKAIQAARDCTDWANKSAVTVTRVDGTKITVNYKKAIKNSKYDVPIYPGDRIHVPRRFP